MKKVFGGINFDFQFDAQRKGAKYTIDGTHYMNGGEFAECATKALFGYMATKDANSKYNEASDIPEIRASVKSSKATLVNMKLADSFNQSVETYFQNTHSTCFIYTVIIDDTVTCYMMNAIEFKTFIYKFATLNERGFVRFKATSGKTIAWLEGLA